MEIGDCFDVLTIERTAGVGMEIDFAVGCVESYCGPESQLRLLCSVVAECSMLHHRVAVVDDVAVDVKACRHSEKLTDLESYC